MNVENLTELQRKLKRLGDQNETRVSVQVGYCQSYALRVHEDMTARHKEGKQAKFLEQPARQLSKTLADIVREVVQRGKRVEDGLLLAGLRLQRESQLIVPVDTSALKASAFTAVERDADARAGEAWAKSEAMREHVTKKRAVRKARSNIKRAKRS